jgi:hypothetical protein
VDPATHRRFLEYLELCEGFLRGGLPKLDKTSFAEVDAEYQHLSVLSARGELDAVGARRIAALRKLLLRD